MVEVHYLLINTLRQVLGIWDIFDFIFNLREMPKGMLKCKQRKLFEVLIAVN